MQTIYKYKNKILVAITILMLIPFVFNIGLESDEPFSMAIINHTYGSIASLTAMDVHPPLYYWILKVFLFITTFWTNSIFIKIIFARLLSLIFSLITLYYLIKILQILKLHYNNYVVSFIFFMCPVVYGHEGIASDIRMYSLGAMLCIICLYYLLLFEEHNKLKYLLFICLSDTFTLYTQYLIGMVTGLYILSVLIVLWLNKKYTSLFKLFLTSIASMILFIPWIPKIITQFSAQSAINHVGIDMTYVFIYYSVIAVLAIIILLNKKIDVNRDTKIILYVNLLITLLILLINMKFNPYSVSVRYTSVALIMNYVIIGTILIYYFNRGVMCKILLVIFALVLLNINVGIELPFQQNTMINPSICFYKEFQSMKNDKNTTISYDKYRLYDYPWDDRGGNSVYLASIKRNIAYNRPIAIYAAVGNGNRNLFKKLFPNLRNYFIVNHF